MNAESLVSLVLYRPSRRSNIYLIDEFSGVVFGQCRSKRDRLTLYRLGHQMLRDGDLKPMPRTKKLDKVREQYNDVFGFGQQADTLAEDVYEAFGVEAA